MIDVSWSPRAFLFKGFLTEEETNHLIEKVLRHTPHVAGLFLGMGFVLLPALCQAVPRLRARLPIWEDRSLACISTAVLVTKSWMAPHCAWHWTTAGWYSWNTAGQTGVLLQLPDAACTCTRRPARCSSKVSSCAGAAKHGEVDGGGQ